MKLRLLRNATLKLEILAKTILIDPFFAPKGSRPSFTGRALNPLVDLPATPEEILDGVELVVVSHLHADHFDPVAQSLVPKHLPMICQPGDEDKIRSYGFSDVTPLADVIDWQGIRFKRREGSHGLGPVVEKMGSVMGFSITAKDEPSIYWAGDTVLYPAIGAIIANTTPEIVIIHRLWGAMGRRSHHNGCQGSRCDLPAGAGLDRNRHSHGFAGPRHRQPGRTEAVFDRAGRLAAAAFDTAGRRDAAICSEAGLSHHAATLR